MWRVGSRPARLAKVSILLWLLLVVGVTILETQCLIDQSYSLTLPTNQCSWHNRAERLGLALAALLAAVALGVLVHRVLLLHKQSATKVGKPSKAFISALGMCGGALLGRVATLIIEASNSGDCAAYAPDCYLVVFEAHVPAGNKEVAQLHEGAHEARRLLLDLFGNWLPELLPPLLIWRLMRLARKLHQRRNPGRRRQSGGGSAKARPLALKGPAVSGSGSAKQLWGRRRTRSSFERGGSHKSTSSFCISRRSLTRRRAPAARTKSRSPSSSISHSVGSGCCSNARSA